MPNPHAHPNPNQNLILTQILKPSHKPQNKRHIVGLKEMFSSVTTLYQIQEHTHTHWIGFILSVDLLGWRVCAFPSQDDRAGMAGSVPELGLSGFGDSHGSGE